MPRSWYIGFSLQSGSCDAGTGFQIFNGSQPGIVFCRGDTNMSIASVQVSVNILVLEKN